VNKFNDAEIEGKREGKKCANESPLMVVIF
jgi:hypothetical protein